MQLPNAPCRQLQPSPATSHTLTDRARLQAGTTIAQQTLTYKPNALHIHAECAGLHYHPSFGDWLGMDERTYADSVPETVLHPYTNNSISHLAQTTVLHTYTNNRAHTALLLPRPNLHKKLTTNDIAYGAGTKFGTLYRAGTLAHRSLPSK